MSFATLITSIVRCLTRSTLASVCSTALSSAMFRSSPVSSKPTATTGMNTTTQNESASFVRRRRLLTN
jgi:hypothetical protein